MYDYVRYGMRIRSCVELSPQANVAADYGEADVMIRMGDAPGSDGQRDRADELVLADNGFVVRVRNGREVIVDAPGEEPSWALRVLLLGPVMAVLAHQRGMLPLHASAIAFGCQVYAFLGGSGAGKSTLAAALNKCGYPIVTDDVLVVEFGADGSAKAHTAFRRLRLRPDAAVAIGPATDGLTWAGLDLDGRLFYEAGEEETPYGAGQPLHAVFVLADGPVHRVSRLDGGDAFRALEQHSYVNREMLEAPGRMRSHFQCCARLMRATCVYRLQRPRSLAELPTTVKEVKSICAGS